MCSTDAQFRSEPARARLYSLKKCVDTGRWRAEAAWAVDQSQARLDKEEVNRSRLEAGELGVDISGLRQKLVDLGVVYVDRLPE